MLPSPEARKERESWGLIARVLRLRAQDDTITVIAIVAKASCQRLFAIANC